MRSKDLGSHWFARNDRHGWPAILRLRDRRLAAGGASGELASRGLGPKSGTIRRIPHRDRTGRSLSGLAAGCAETSSRMRWAFVTGATMANFTALAAARHAVLARAGWDVEADGLFGAPPITVVVGDEVHPSLIEALGMLGLGRSRVVRVPVDRAGADARCRNADAGRTGDRLHAGRQREHGRIRSSGRNLRARSIIAERGCTWTVRSGYGPR